MTSNVIEDCEPYDSVSVISCAGCNRRWLRVSFEQPLVTKGSHFFDALLPDDFPFGKIPNQQAEIENLFLQGEVCYLGGDLFSDSPQPVYRHIGIPERKI